MYCIAHIDTEKSWRGGQQQVFSLIEGLIQRGHKNIAFVRRDGPLAERLCRLDCVVEEINPWGEYSLFTAGYVALRLQHHGVQLVHAHSGHAVSLSALATLRDHVPFILTRRVDFPVASNPASWWKYNRASKIIAISEAVARVLVESGIDPEKIVKVYSGVDFRRYSHVVALTRPQMGLPENAIVVGQIAALAPHKDQRTFLSAIKVLHLRNPLIRAVLVGDGPKKQSLIQQAIALGLEKVVHFVGFREDALQWLKSFDVFCLSSKEEGLGTSVVDAMALEVPIVATRAGGIPELIDDHQTGYLVPAQDPAALALAIENILKNRSECSDMVRRAAQRARDFNISKTVEKTELVYRSILTP